MSITDAGSTNDMSSTMGTSLTSNPSATRITADTIIKECIRQGYYRNPVCNEVLYLHRKGYDSIEPSAFDRYVDVKVLWLEGNGFSALACGEDFIQVKPPKAEFLMHSSDEDAVDGEQPDNDSENRDDLDAVPASKRTEEERAERHVDPMSARTLPQSITGRPAKRSPRYRGNLLLPDNSTVAVERKDVFSSLYRTVRQLYLHNNVFRVMPDLSRFQRLDSVNLSGNFFPTVRPCCPHWLESMAHFLQEEEEALGSSKSAIRARQRELESAAVLPPTETEETRVVPAEEARAKREAQMQKYASQLKRFSSFCRHVPLSAEECGKRWHRIPASQRCPCSSLRSLNLSGNHIETFDDLVGLLCYKSLTMLDLSNNQIKDGEMLLMILERLGSLSTLKLNGNPVVRSLRRYRKTVAARCCRLLHLDDRPIFEEERRMINAWAAGGDAAEERERQQIKAENQAKEKKRLDDFRRLISRSSRSSAGHHDAFISAITTQEALRAIEQEEQQSSATSEETDENEDERPHPIDGRMPYNGTIVRHRNAAFRPVERSADEEESSIYVPES